MPVIGQNRSGDDFTAFWEIWSASGRLLDNQAPDKHVKEKKKVSRASLARWDFYLSRPLSASSARMLFPSPTTQSDTNWEDIYCTFAILWDTGIIFVSKLYSPEIRATTVFMSVKDITWLLNSVGYLWQLSLSARSTQMFSLCRGSLLAEASSRAA